MYHVKFQSCIGSCVFEIRIARWIDVVKWLGEQPGMYRLRVDMEGV